MALQLSLLAATRDERILHRSKEGEMSMTIADLYQLHVKCCQQNWSLVIGAMSITLEFQHPEKFDCAITFVLITNC